MNTNELNEFKNILEETIKNTDEIYIAPHIGPDFDAIASSLGISEIAKKFKKNNFILINDDDSTIEQGVSRIIENTRDKYSYINLDGFKQNMDNGLTKTLITVDVNKSYLVCVNEYFDYFKPIILIDHHCEDEKTIETDKKLIDTTVSSASEIITRLLKQFNVKFDSYLASYLYAGIKLDSSNFSKNMSSKAFEVVTKLTYIIMKELDLDFVDQLFLEDFENDRKIQNLVDKTLFQSFKIAIAMNHENPNMIYTKEDLAKVADYLLKYNVSAAFAMGYIDESTISISARSKGTANSFDVGKVMAHMQGGGNETSGATKIDASTTDLENVRNELQKILKP